MKLLYKLFLDAPIQWFLDYLMPVLYPLLPDRLVQWNERGKANRLQRRMLMFVMPRIKKNLERCSAIIKQGSQAEETAEAAVRELKEKAPDFRIMLFETNGTVWDAIVLPGDAQRDLASQEFDLLMVCAAGVFVIEVKSWTNINPDGSHYAPDGSLLKPAHLQSTGKVKRLKEIVGDGVPVHSLVYLPRLDPYSAPAALPPSYVCDVPQLMLAIRDKMRHLRDRQAIDIHGAFETIQRHLDRSGQAKLTHMLWLAQNHPSPDTLEIERLYNENVSLQKGALSKKSWLVRIPLMADSDSIPIADSVPCDGGHAARVS
ncbi:MAG: nuclease-related domain-containing protein [Halothiobacillaceae bacterium]